MIRPRSCPTHFSRAPSARPDGALFVQPRRWPGSGRWRYLRRADGGGASAHPLPVVIGSIGSRLRLVLRQPGPSVRAGAADATGLPEIDFVAYSTSERLSGRIRLDRARLT